MSDLNFEDISEDIAIEIHAIVNAERGSNPNGDNVSPESDARIDSVRERILANLLAANG